MSPVPTISSPPRATRSSNGIFKRKKSDIAEEEDEDEEDEKKSGKAKDGSTRIYAEGEVCLFIIRSYLPLLH